LTAALLGVVTVTATLMTVTDGRANGADGGAAEAAPATVPGVVLVGYEPSTTAAARTDIRAEVDSTPTTAVERVASNTDLVHLDAGTSVADAVDELKMKPGVRFAEPDYRLHKMAQSNDPLYADGRLWGMYGDASSPSNQYGSQAAEAWAQGKTGSRSVYVGVIDEGIQVDHPDLAPNVWTNPFDPVDGVDNDGNGYVDDIRGWDFFNHDNSVFDGNPTAGFDDHGTHVSGTIAGVGGNGTGVAGVNWQATLIPAKFLGPDFGTTSDAVAAVDYLTDLKVRHGLNIVATSNSWGGGGYSQALLDAIDRAGDAGILFVAAAGNESTDNDAVPHYPSSYECTKGGTRGWDCVVSVAAIDSTGGLAFFSNSGATSVDLAAPGVDIWSTTPNGYESYSGTSMATPHVSGALALCASLAPNATPAQLREAVLESTVATPSVAGRTVTGGRLDVSSMTSRCSPALSPVTGRPWSLRVTASAVDSATLRWTDGVRHEDRFQIQRAPSAFGFCGAFSDAGTAAANATSAVVTGLTPGTPSCFRVRGTNSYHGGSSTWWSNVARGRTQRNYACRADASSWIDPRVGGTNLGLGDDTSATVALPFPVSPYGSRTSAISVSSNGFVRFDNGDATAYENAPIPSTSGPNAFAAPFWDDLNPAAGGGVWTRTVGAAPHRKVAVGWVDVPHFGITTGAVSVELVLHEGEDTFGFRYRDATFGDATVDLGASATAGVENATGTTGKQLSFDQPALRSRTAAVCSTNRFRLLPRPHGPGAGTVHSG
jgi:subtilisin family serine protease